MRDHAIGHPALTDRPTGLANRLHFELVYSYLFQAADRGVAMTVLLLSFGSEEFEASDPETLHVLGGRMQDSTRTSDLAGHLGHGRLVVLLFCTNIAGGMIAADRIEQAVLELNLGRVSIGLANYEASMKEPSELLETADRALRAAEEAGGGVELA